MDLSTWTRKGKDSNIYYIYTYLTLYILIGMLPKSQSLESLLVLFVTASATTTTVVIVFVCVCVTLANSLLLLR